MGDPDEYGGGPPPDDGPPDGFFGDDGFDDGFGPPGGNWGPPPGTGSLISNCQISCDNYRQINANFQPIKRGSYIETL